MHLVGLLIHTLQYDARSVQRQIGQDYFSQVLKDISKHGALVFSTSLSNMY